MVFRARTLLLGLSIGLSVSSVLAQESTSITPASAPANTAVTLSDADAKKLVTLAQAAFYRPVDLSGISCRASIDWDSVAKQLGQAAPAERMAALKNMIIEVEAVRGQNAKAEFTWKGDPPPKKQDLEDSATQMIKGFFQMYWNFTDGLVPAQTDSFKVQTSENGGHEFVFKQAGTSVTTTVDADAVPTKTMMDSPVLKATMLPHFSPSPNPEPGDLRRLTSMDISEEIGATSLKVNLTMDYQYVQGFNIPQHATIGLSAAYSIPMEFSACSISKK